MILMNPKNIFCDMFNEWIDIVTCKELCKSLGNSEVEECSNCYKQVLN